MIYTHSPVMLVTHIIFAAGIFTYASARHQFEMEHGQARSDYLSLTCSSNQFHSFSPRASSYASGRHSPTRAQGMRNCREDSRE